MQIGEDGRNRARQSGVAPIAEIEDTEPPMTTTICLTFDFDATSSWIRTFKQTTPGPLSRGEYGARVGVPRLLWLLRKHGITATFFVPGLTALNFPAETQAIRDGGHEIAAHGHTHESPTRMSRENEVADFVSAEATLHKIVGQRPVGYRSPAWDLSPHTLALLVERGYRYSSNLMSDDFAPFAPRINDEVHADGTVSYGTVAPIIEFPVAWELDDFVYFNFMGKTLEALRSAEEVGRIWLAEFDYCARHVQGGVFTLTMHPQVIGRGPRIMMLDWLLCEMKKYPDVKFSRMIEAADARQHLIGNFEAPR